MVRTTYTLGWIFLILAIVERILMTSASISGRAVQHNVLPHNLFDLAGMFFLIAIASRVCCGSCHTEHASAPK